MSSSKADAARAQLAKAKARLKSAQAKLQKVRARLAPKGEENPAIAAARAQLAQARYDLASTTVEAPHDGVVTNLTLSKGQYINAGEPALTFINTESKWITVALRENQLQNVDPGDPVHLLFDAVPGEIFKGRVASVAWGISPGRKVQNGLVVSQPNNRWFAPARGIPVHIELAGETPTWPRKVRVGSKVDVVILAGGNDNPIAWIASGLQWLQSWASYLH